MRGYGGSVFLVDFTSLFTFNEVYCGRSEQTVIDITFNASLENLLLSDPVGPYIQSHPESLQFLLPLETKKTKEIVLEDSLGGSHVFDLNDFLDQLCERFGFVDKKSIPFIYAIGQQSLQPIAFEPPPEQEQRKTLLSSSGDALFQLAPRLEQCHALTESSDFSASMSESDMSSRVIDFDQIAEVLPGVECQSMLYIGIDEFLGFSCKAKGGGYLQLKKAGELSQPDLKQLNSLLGACKGEVHGYLDIDETTLLRFPSLQYQRTFINEGLLHFLKQHIDQKNPYTILRFLTSRASPYRIQVELQQEWQSFTSTVFAEVAGNDRLLRQYYHQIKAHIAGLSSSPDGDSSLMMLKSLQKDIVDLFESNNEFKGKLMLALREPEGTASPITNALKDDPAPIEIEALLLELSTFKKTYSDVLMQREHKLDDYNMRFTDAQARHRHFMSAESVRKFYAVRGVKIALNRASYCDSRETGQYKAHWLQSRYQSVKEALNPKEKLLVFIFEDDTGELELLRKAADALNSDNFTLVVVPVYHHLAVPTKAQQTMLDFIHSRIPAHKKTSDVGRSPSVTDMTLFSRKPEAVGGGGVANDDPSHVLSS